MMMSTCLGMQPNVGDSGDGNGKRTATLPVPNNNINNIIHSTTLSAESGCSQWEQEEDQLQDSLVEPWPDEGDIISEYYFFLDHNREVLHVDIDYFNDEVTVYKLDFSRDFEISY